MIGNDMKSPLGIRLRPLLLHEAKDPQGRILGRVEDLILDFSVAQLIYVVLQRDLDSHGPLRYSAIPWGLCHLADDGITVIADIDPQLLQSSPSFTEDEWPSWNDGAWHRQLYGHFRIAPYWETPENYQG
jgi:hypothetical protein